MHPERPDSSGFRLAGLRRIRCPPATGTQRYQRAPAGGPCQYALSPAIAARLPGMGLIITLLIIWLVLSILGFVIEGLLWLALIGLVLFAATAVWGWMKRRV